ncbi:MAG TPA: hypothetical protein VM574_06105, partial [Terrimicrobiaceae bacterium]|nr:hypothetical protein [Terrimicrobiaceae bacterium]
GVGRDASFRLARLAAIFLSGSPGMANGSSFIPSRGAMRGISHVWLRFAFALLLTLAVTALTFPRSIGLTRTASLETISPGQDLLSEAPWPRSLRRVPLGGQSCPRVGRD